MPNSVNTLKILVGIYFRVLYLFYVKVPYFTRVHSLQSILQIMDHAARRTPTHQLQALRACPRAWLQVLEVGRLLLGVPVRDVPARAGPGSRCASWVGRPPAERVMAAPIFGESVSAVLYTPILLDQAQISTGTSLVAPRLCAPTLAHQPPTPTDSGMSGLQL